MWKVISQEQIGDLARERSVVTILLARSMNADFLRWLYHSWNEIHEIAGARWHIVIPSKSGRWVWAGDGPDIEDFNTALSLEIANSYGISRRRLPCLILEDFCEDAVPIRIAIPEDEKGRAKFVDDFSDIIASLSGEDFSAQNWLGRRGVNAAIADSLGRKKMAANGLKLLPKAVGAFAKFGFNR